MSQRIHRAIVLLAAVISLAVPALAGQKVVAKAALVATAEGAHTLALEVMKKALAGYTNGDFELQIYTDSQLGDEREIIEGVGLGTIEIGVVNSGPVSNFIPEFRMLDFPYLFTDFDSIPKILNSPVGRKLLDRFEGIGIYAPSFWDCGYRYTTTNIPVVHPSDLKGLKLRTMENELHMALFRHLGATPTPMAISEFMTAVRQGTVDGHENVLFSIYTKKIHESNKYIGNTKHLYSPAPLIINKAFYDGLSDDMRLALDKAENEANLWLWEYGKTVDADMLEKMKTEGAIVTEVDVAEWREATKGVYEEFKHLLDEELLEQIRAVSAK